MAPATHWQNRPVAGNANLAVMKICIDPGHGMPKDPGAVGPKGHAESLIVLEISRLLADFLEKARISTLLTRAQEVFIELGARCEIANDWGANYFVSVHANSNGPSAAGIETLYKSEKGKALALPVQEAMIAATGDVDRSVKHRSDLYVLNATLMPAILVEVGFISHPHTESLLASAEYQETLAKAIYTGITNHLGWHTEPRK